LNFPTGPKRYEFAQYTPEAKDQWHRWLQARFGTVAALNTAYRTVFKSFDEISMRSRNGSAFRSSATPI